MVIRTIRWPVMLSQTVRFDSRLTVSGLHINAILTNQKAAFDTKMFTLFQKVVFILCFAYPTFQFDYVKIEISSIFFAPWQHFFDF